MALKVIKNVRVSPATKSSEESVNSFSFPLTFFELGWIKFHPSQRVIFYRLTESSSETFHSHILPKLKLSLSFVIGYYLPLAGRLTWKPQDPKPSIIVSKHDTVSLTVAETDADFSFLSSNGLRPAALFHPLVPELEVSDDSATLLSIQITLFPNQGFCVGIASHHSVNDGTTSALFIKSWAHICRLQEHSNAMDFPLLPKDLTPTFDRTDRDDFKTLKPPPLDEISSEVVRATIELTSENIEKLRQRVKNQSARSPLELHLSAFVIAYAYSWTSVVKPRGGNPNRPVRFIYTADFRSRLNPPLPATYFGSCVFAIGWLQYEARTFLKEDGFIKAVEILSESVKKLGSKGIESLFEDYVQRAKNIIPDAQAGSVAGSTRLAINGTDFGWGRPIKTEFVSIDRNEAFSMLERRDDSGGVEIGVCLKKGDMNIFLSLFKDGLSD
ncbi:HXXXD-type acyl-transferase family protein [Raphanus sativus]|nr:HXXXD-type acyl-transferase family protein [Raphanus sativus]